MKVASAIADIEACASLPQLKDVMQKIAENHGFASFNFLDVGNPHLDVPYYIGTTGTAWEDDYKANGFVHVDYCVKAARRANLPFNWDDVPVPAQQAGPKTGVRRLLDAAADHGFTNGMVVPHHYRDKLGRYYSSLCVFYWKDTMSRFRFMLRHRKLDLQIIVYYWVQRAVDLVAESRDAGSSASLGPQRNLLAQVPLTDRERDVLAWAARGKTTGETAEILGISTETAQTHTNRAMRKLDATNKTHATVQAIYLGLIDP
jgi:DNA-binding CsgD family transcriptional regulator